MVLVSAVLVLVVAMVRCVGGVCCSRSIIKSSLSNGGSKCSCKNGCRGRMLIVVGVVVLAMVVLVVVVVEGLQ